MADAAVQSMHQMKIIRMSWMSFIYVESLGLSGHMVILGMQDTKHENLEAIGNDLQVCLVLKFLMLMITQVHMTFTVPV